jgi:hypothetical protein
MPPGVASAMVPELPKLDVKQCRGPRQPCTRPFRLHQATHPVFSRREYYLKWKTIPAETRRLFCVWLLPLPNSGK